MAESEQSRRNVDNVLKNAGKVRETAAEAMLRARKVRERLARQEWRRRQPGPR